MATLQIKRNESQEVGRLSMAHNYKYFLDGVDITSSLKSLEISMESHGVPFAKVGLFLSGVEVDGEFVVALQAHVDSKTICKKESDSAKAEEIADKLISLVSEKAAGHVRFDRELGEKVRIKMLSRGYDIFKAHEWVPKDMRLCFDRDSHPIECREGEQQFASGEKVTWILDRPEYKEPDPSIHPQAKISECRFDKDADLSDAEKAARVIDTFREAIKRRESLSWLGLTYNVMFLVEGDIKKIEEVIGDAGRFVAHHDGNDIFRIVYTPKVTDTVNQ